MALIFKVPMAFRCCRMPERMAALSLDCFLHALGPRSPAASTRAKTKRFMLVSSSTRRAASRVFLGAVFVSEPFPSSFLDSIAHVQGQADVDNGQNGESITERPMDHVPKLKNALRTAEEGNAFGQLGLGFGDAQGTKAL